MFQEFDHLDGFIVSLGNGLRTVTRLFQLVPGLDMGEKKRFVDACPYVKACEALYRATVLCQGADQPNAVL